ncbi:uncharacterized protein KY384_007232 [Bacidia gigantensis]|uniref:uncharacterized protein n=1 Tax=Bacidia gigantensis TaxID=2732470 RepID=UPI001D052AAE|nr:uncharacterized protein KY384_007232 [Bacidia gigantensis]KAG8528315.1 hypothetical protein KY384_007232 [Bacidia gigantensis]
MEQSNGEGFEDDISPQEEELKQRPLPLDLPRSLDDRQPVRHYGAETEMYDAWQGQSQLLSSPVPSQPLAFNLNLNDDPRDDTSRSLQDNDTRLMEMLAAQAAHREEGSAGADEEAIVNDSKIPEAQKKALLQKSLHNAASNGDIEQIGRLLKGSAGKLIDINGPDEEGTAPIIYASCFGHQDVVSALLEAGAGVDRQDKNQWTPLMWAMTNRHKEIAKILLDHGASTDVKSSSGRTAFDFTTPNSEMSSYLRKNGYGLGDVGVGEDFYDGGFSQDKFEQEMEESEMTRRMMMESSINLEVDLSSLGMDEQPDEPEEFEEQQEFVWDKCLNDQMFVFQEAELDQILDIIITSMNPSRSPSQKPVPANILFLAARYAHYHANPDLLANLLLSAMDKINSKVERHQWDMTILSFWISNATLLLHYLKKDAGLVMTTAEFQVQLVELINEIFILIIRDAERRIDKVLRNAILDHETIPFDHLEFAGEWNLFKSKPKAQPEPVSYKPPPPSKRAKLSPRNVTSLLSSTLFVLDLYDIHSVITSQVISQLFYWIGAELFNHIISNKIYLARTKAMQIRMNISTLEDWARTNNRSPEHYENGSLSASGENTVEAARKHLTPSIQLLQWLQCFSSLDFLTDLPLDETISQMTQLTPHQLLHCVNHYRYEKEEKTMPKAARKRLQARSLDGQRKWEQMRKDREKRRSQAPPASPQSPQKNVTPTLDQAGGHALSSPTSNDNNDIIPQSDEDEPPSKRLLMDPAHMLQFSLPTTVDMRLSYGAGYGGVNREREKKYIPTVPPEFLAKLDINGSGNGSFVNEKDWDTNDDS